MARPGRHDGVLYERTNSSVWWMRYRDRDGRRCLETTGTEDWQEAQRKLRGRLQARDQNTLPTVRRGEKLLIQRMGGFFPGELFSAPHSCCNDPRGKRDGAKTSEARTWETEACGDRCRSDREVCALANPSTKAGAHVIRFPPARDPEADYGAPEVPGFAPNLQRRGGVSDFAEGSVSSILRYVVGAAAYRVLCARVLCQCDPDHHGISVAGA
jgi:hypothetical protein